MKKTNTKLKTLKDLIQNESCVPKSVSSVLMSDLKSAAIEWIKNIKEHMKEVRHPDSYHQGSIDWIEIFFNLNENKRKAQRKIRKFKKEPGLKRARVKTNTTTSFLFS